MAEFTSFRPGLSGESFRVPEAGDVIAGKYRVEAVVGTGGMGIVLSAFHLKLRQSVAIKVLTMSGISEGRRHEAQARFLHEAQAAAGLTSDHVVRVFDVGTLDSGVPYMVMELLSGDDLAVIVDREGPLPVELAVDYVGQACDAIAEAHARGIVHRDLKPANLFVARKKDGRTTVKVLDFGISKAVVGGEDPLDGNLTATRSIVGSPYYMSPEQVRDAKGVDVRTDIWSLGMILYELLIGEPAFDAETLPGICAAIAADPPPPIRMARPAVPIELEGVILRCLEKDPAQRFQTVEELLGALLPFLPGTRGSVTADRPRDAPVARRAVLTWLAVGTAVLAAATYSYFAARAPSPAARAGTSSVHSATMEPPPMRAQVPQVVQASSSPPQAAPVSPAPASEAAAPPKLAADPARSHVRVRSTRRVRPAKTQPVAPATEASDIRLER